MATLTETAAMPRKRPAWWLVALLLLVALGIGGGASWYFLGHQQSADKTPEKAAPPPVPEFVELKPFTVNVGDDSGRVLYTGITLQASDQATAATLNEHMPEVRSRVLMVLTSQSSDTLTSAEGKQSLSRAIVDAFDKPFNDGQTTADVTQALFTDFIVQ